MKTIPVEEKKPEVQSGMEPSNPTFMAESPSEAIEDLKERAVQDGEPPEFMKPDKKRGRGRPKGSTSEKKEGIPHETKSSAADQIIANKKLMLPMWQAISGVGVKLAEDKEAAIGVVEMEVLVDTSAACVHQYLPNLLGEHANLIVLSVTFAQWSLRVYLLRQAKLEQLIAERRMGKPGSFREEPFRTPSPMQ